VKLADQARHGYLICSVSVWYLSITRVIRTPGGETCGYANQTGTNKINSARTYVMSYGQNCPVLEGTQVFRAARLVPVGRPWLLLICVGRRLVVVVATPRRLLEAQPPTETNP
jgi:hypothetical protein